MLSVKRSLRLCLRVCVTLAALLLMSECLVKFLEDEIGTQISFVDSETVAFPSLAICWKNGYKQSELSLHGFKNILKVLENLQSNESVSELMDVTRFELEEFLETINIKTRRIVNDNYTHNVYDVLRHPHSSLHFTRRALRKQGYCYVTSMPEVYRSASISEVHLVFFSDPKYRMTNGIDFRERGWEVLLHSKGQLQAAKVRVHTRQRFNLAFRVEHGLFLRRGESQECSEDMDEVLDHCLHQHEAKVTWEKMKCLYPWTLQDNVTLDKEIMDQLKTKDIICEENDFYSMNVLSRLKSEVRASSDLVCKRPCQMMDFNVIPMSENRQIVLSEVAGFQAFLSIYFEDQVQVTSEFKTYGLLSMVGEASGYLGLFLGVSCYQVIGFLFADNKEDDKQDKEEPKKKREWSMGKKNVMDTPKVFVVRKVAPTHIKD